MHLKSKSNLAQPEFAIELKGTYWKENLLEYGIARSKMVAMRSILRLNRYMYMYIYVHTYT